MHIHYYTLKRQVAYLQSVLPGSQVTESYTARKNEWLLRLQKDAGEEQVLALGCDPHYPYMVVRAPFPRKANTTDVLDELVGLRIRHLSLWPGERIVEVEFHSSALRLVAQFFTLNTNFFLIDEQQIIRNSFKKASKWVGQPLVVKTSSRLDPATVSWEDFQAVMEAGQQELAAVLKSKFRHLTGSVLPELLARGQLSGQETASALPDAQLRFLYDQLKQLFEQFREQPPRIYHQEGIPRRFTLGPFVHLSHLEFQVYEEVNEALRQFCFQSLRWHQFRQKQAQLLQRVQTRLKQIQKNLEKLASSPPPDEKQRWYQKIGELLLSQPQAFHPEKGRVQLVDYFDPAQRVIEVSVDPGLSLAENARRYFQRARLAQQRGQELQQRRQQLEARSALLQKALQELQQATTWKLLERWEEKLKREHVLQPEVEEREAYRLPYRRYEKDGYEIWVGRSARDNDLLTFRLAGKEDWWLHVQGYGGSHVIVRNPGRLEQLPPSVLEYAARLAVTHSQARHARYVPVLVTKVKYVRKPRKSAPGSVVAERTRTLFVDPLPE